MKKRIAIALGMVCLTAVLASCGRSASDSSKEEDEEGTQTVTIVTSGSGEPYSLLDDDMNWSGIDAEIWAVIAERTGWNVELKRAAFDSIFGELDAGRADLTANCWAIKEERTDKYYASIPYYGDSQMLAVAGDNQSVNTFKDLRGKRVGVTSGQASETILEEMSREYGFELVTYEDTAGGLQQVTMGRIDAMGGAVTTVNNYTKNTGNDLRILDEKLMANNVGYFFPKTEKGKALCEEVNQQLQLLLEDGTIGKITEKWLFEDMTPYIISADTEKK